MNKNYLFILIVFLFALTGCFGHRAYVDKVNRLTGNEIKIYIEDSLKEIYNKDFIVEFYKKDNIELCGFYTSDCHSYYKVKGAYSYTYKITDSNEISAYAVYIDPYYDNGVLKEIKYSDTYERVYSSSTHIDDYRKIIHSYLSDDEIKKLEFDSSSTFYVYDDVYLNLYLNYKLEDLTSELYGRLHNLSYDLNNAKNQFNDSSVTKIKVLFLENEKSYSIDNIYGLIDDDTHESLIPDDYYEYDFDLLNDKCKIVYNEMYNYLINIVNTNQENAKKISEAFIRFSNYYIYNVEYIDHKYIEESNKYIIKIENKTKNNYKLGIEISVIFNSELNTYVGDTIYLISGSVKNSTATIIEDYKVS